MQKAAEALDTMDIDLDALDVIPHTPEEDEAFSAMKTQVGGSHYKDFVIQPAEFIHKNKIGYLEGNVIKYLCRWRNKNGVEDLKKARHYLDILIEMEQSA